MKKLEISGMLFLAACVAGCQSDSNHKFDTAEPVKVKISTWTSCENDCGASPA